MDRIVRLLQERNRYLEKFYKLNEVGLEKFRTGDFEALDSLYDKREEILKVISFLDTELNKSTELMTPEQVSESFKATIEGVMSQKESLVKAIVAQDLEIIGYIEREKTAIIRELQETKMIRKGITGYRVNTFQKRLDEKV